MKTDQWWDETYNPIAMRCTRVGAGCNNCWHLRFADRHARNPHFSAEIRAACAGKGPPVLREDVLEKPLSWKKPRRIAVQMMGDLFHDDVTDAMRDRIWGVMAKAWWHTFIVLSKRPNAMDRSVQRMGEIPEHARRIWLEAQKWPWPSHYRREAGNCDWPLLNVILGVSAWDQESAGRMIPQLLQIPAARRGVSLEPLLGPVDLATLRSETGWVNALTGVTQYVSSGPSLNWVIVGAETGPHARPMPLQWARDLRDQCREAGVPFWFKKTSPGMEIPQDLLVREWPCTDTRIIRT